jgi:hypothetical protein
MPDKVGLIIGIYWLRGFPNGLLSQGKNHQYRTYNANTTLCKGPPANQLTFLSCGNYNPHVIRYVEKNKPPTLRSQLLFAFTGINTFICAPKEEKKPTMALV